MFTCKSQCNLNNVIFSSTAAVYGTPINNDPIKETSILKPLNPYGKSKFKIDYKVMENKYQIDFKKYFNKEISNLNEFIKDSLVVLSNEQLIITELGTNFTPQIANIFDKYNPQKIYTKNIFDMNQNAQL